MPDITPREVASAIDHTCLGPDGGRDAIRKLCDEAREYGFAAVALAPCYVTLASEALAGTGVAVNPAIGFPNGYSTSRTKAQQARQALEEGADEIDMVINIGAVKDGRWGYVRRELELVADVVGEHTFKVILENCYLTPGEITRLSRLCMEVSGIDFIKTSTGFGPGGAEVEDVRLMRDVVGGNLRIKAAGGIRSGEDFLDMRAAGADRIGTSSGVKIVEHFMG